MDPLSALLASLQGGASGPAVQAGMAAGAGGAPSPLVSMLSDILGGGGQEPRTATHGVTMPQPLDRFNQAGMPAGSGQPPDGMDAATFSGAPASQPIPPAMPSYEGLTPGRNGWYGGPPPARNDAAPGQGALADWLQRTFGGGRGNPGQPPDGMDAKTYGVTEPAAAQRGVAVAPPMKPGSPPPALAERQIVDGPAPTASQPYTAGPAAAPVGRALSEVLLTNGGAAGRPPVPATPAKPAPTIAGDLGSIIRNALIGAANVDPTRSKLGAAIQGAAGATKGLRDEQLQQQMMDAARADKQFDQGLKLSGENRAVAKDARDARSQNIANTKTVQEIIRGASGDLTPDQRLRLESDVMRYARVINPSGTMLEPEFQQRLAAYRNEAEARVRGTTVAPQQGGQTQQPNAGKAGAATGGDGKSAQSAARPANQAAFDALPKGAFFINPRDGQLMQKK